MNQLSILHAMILGFVQGASEFLPVSSSGHLVIFQHLLGIDLDAGSLVAFDVCLHVGTLLAVVFALWREIGLMLKGLCGCVPQGTSELDGGFTMTSGRHVVWLVLLGTIPAVIFGFAFKDFFESLFTTRLPIGIALMVTGTILFATRFVRISDVKAGEMKWWHALIVGCAQACAIIPGISRSGSTIAAGLFSRLDRTLAAKFSFLLAIPAIGGAAVLQYKNFRHLSQENFIPILLGTLVSFVVGFICVRWMLRIVRGGNFALFAYYCWAVGAATILWALSGS
jgi:undecaprenyl-diphosphatase